MEAERAANDLTGEDFHIGVCRACGRYGQLSAEGRVCAVAEPHRLLVGKAGVEHFRRTRACQRIAARRAERAARPERLAS